MVWLEKASIRIQFISKNHLYVIISYNNYAIIISMSSAFEGWYGPRTITQARQVSIPVELLRRLGIESGNRVYIALIGDELRIRPAESGAQSRED